MRPMDGGKAAPPVQTQPYAEIADTAARNRLRGEMSDCLRAQYPEDNAAFAVAIQRALEMDMAAVVAAEIARKGSGLTVWLGLLGWHGNRAAM